MGVHDFLVSSALAGVLAQRLCRRLCRHCARPAEDPGAILNLLPRNTADALAAACESDAAVGGLMQPMGCKRCGNTGYDGRMGIFELLVVTDEMRRAIMAGRDEQTLVELARGNGMRLLVEDGVLKSYLHDQISAKQYDLAPTGSGRRQSYKYAPMPRMSCTFMEDGPHTKEEIIEALNEYVDSYIGTQVLGLFLNINSKQTFFN